MTRYYVVNDQLELLKTTRNEILFGRRGTGKTHLLAALREAYLAESENAVTIPVYVDLQRLKGSPHLPTISGREKADFCAIGSWGGRRPNLAPSLKLSGPEGARGWAA